MVIDTTISIVALASGLFGALFTAYLNYKIRHKIALEQEARKRHSLAHVHFLQFTDAVAAEFLVKNIFEKLSPNLEKFKDEQTEKGNKFDVDHSISAYIANAIVKVEEPKKQKLKIIIPLIDLINNLLEKAILSEDKLADLPKETVFFYQRYMRFSYQLMVNFEFIKTSIENDEISLIDEKIIHGIWTTVKRYFSAASLLRSAFVEYGGINKDYAFKALLRSYEELRKEIAENFMHSPKLDEAKNYIKQKETESS